VREAWDRVTQAKDEPKEAFRRETDSYCSIPGNPEHPGEPKHYKGGKQEDGQNNPDNDHDRSRA
jgi:hypothetical protein